MQTIVGIDISKKYFDADINGKVCRYDNDHKSFKKIIKHLPANSHCIMESTSTYGNKLAYALHEAGHIVYIVNPLQVSSYAKMRLSKVKTDKSDAKLITEFAKVNLQDLRPYDFPDKSILSAKQIETVLSQLKTQRTALSNQLEALKQNNFVSEASEKVLTETMQYFDVQIAKLEKHEKDQIDKQHKEMREKITSISGIGNSTACMMISMTNGFSNFSSAKQLSSYFGCCPRVRQSGSSIRNRGTISKIGMSQARTRLYMCAMSAKKYNRTCKELFDRLRAKGKPFKSALLAVVNKLIRQIYAVISKNEVFDNNYVKKFAY
ncbi:MAG: IS110 family transposase [Bacteroidota bacterium]|jgi:transposase